MLSLKLILAAALLFSGSGFSIAEASTEKTSDSPLQPKKKGSSKKSKKAKGKKKHRKSSGSDLGKTSKKNHKYDSTDLFPPDNH